MMYIPIIYDTKIIPNNVPIDYRKSQFVKNKNYTFNFLYSTTIPKSDKVIGYVQVNKKSEHIKMGGADDYLSFTTTNKFKHYHKIYSIYDVKNLTSIDLDSIKGYIYIGNNTWVGYIRKHTLLDIFR